MDDQKDRLLKHVSWVAFGGMSLTAVCVIWAAGTDWQPVVVFVFAICYGIFMVLSAVRKRLRQAADPEAVKNTSVLKSTWELAFTILIIMSSCVGLVLTLYWLVGD